MDLEDKQINMDIDNLLNFSEEGSMNKNKRTKNWLSTVSQTMKLI